MGFNDLLKDVQTVAIICNQFGDSGKGKFSDYFSEWADVIARGTGGNNAGHTVVVNGHQRIFHLIPAGISRDAEGKITVLGNGMVIDLKVLCEELDQLDAEKNTYNNLMISQDAHVVMPYHIQRDKEKNKSQKNGGIGSTGRGIGPCYADKTERTGITIQDLFDRDKLFKKINRSIQKYPEHAASVEEIIEMLNPFAQRIKPFVKDTISEMHEFMRQGKKILLEGAQGLFLSVEHGIHPYVTSSDCSLNGTASGVGLSAKMIDLPLGIVKFPFMTRVGGGPFPTELDGKNSEIYATEEHTKTEELEKYGIPHEKINGKIRYNPADPKILEMINSENEFIQAIGIRLAAGEYGSTTGRARRIGWTDAVMGKYSVGVNGPLLILTKADSLAGAKEFKICYGYEDEQGVTEKFPRREEFLRKAIPKHKTYKGYGNISNIRDYENLPESLKESIKDFEKFTGGKVVIVSVGADRDETIVR